MDVTLEFVADGRLAVLMLDGGPVNVLTPELLRAFTDALDAYEASEARALVIGSEITGVFASGGDVELVARTDGTGFVTYMHALREAIDRLAALETPTIAAVDGAALGGGLELALACTLRVAGDGARLALPQVRLGTIPAAGGTQRLPRMIGHGKALDLLVTGRSVDASEAYAIGLVDRLAPAGGALSAAVELAREIAAASLPAVSAVRRAAAASAGSFPEGMAVEAREALALFERGEAREGFDAFLQHRPPNFA
jgi:enoyl-CoA hydratase/carnithine racemase